MGMDDRAADLQTIYQIAVKVFDSKEKATAWMIQENKALGGETPQAYILSDRLNAFEEVKNILGRIEHGIYS